VAGRYVTFGGVPLSVPLEGGATMENVIASPSGSTPVKVIGLFASSAVVMDCGERERRVFDIADGDRHRGCVGPAETIEDAVGEAVGTEIIRRGQIQQIGSENSGNACVGSLTISRST
jgi:hypothetical protein